MDRNKIPQDPRHLAVPLGASEMISKHVAHLAQNVHQSCVKMSTVSKRTETNFHMSLVTEEYD
jgi:hypothetical protein